MVLVAQLLGKSPWPLKHPSVAAFEAQTWWLMKMQLTPAQVRGFSLKLTQPSPTLEADVLRVLDLFREEGHTPFTWRDFRSVVESLGWSFEGYDIWTASCRQAFWSLASKASRRGFYELPPPSESPTRKFILKMIEEESLDRNLASRLKAKFPQMDWDDLLSTTHLWLFKWAQRGTCDKYILEGKPPTAAIFSAWLTGKVQQEIYSSATNPIMREYGLRTQKEILRRKQTGDDTFIMGGYKTDPDAPDVAWTRGPDEQARPVFVSPEPDDEVVFTEEQLAVVRDGIRALRTRAPERYVSMFDAMMDNVDKAALAEKEGVTVVRVNALFQKVRADMAHLPKVMEVSLKVLDLLSREPFSTLAEVQAEASLTGKETKTVFRFLTLRGLVQEHPGNSYIPTPKGTVLLNSGVWAQ